MKREIDYLAMTTIFLLCITSIAGVLAMDFSKSYEVINQYGDTVRMFGNGLYAHDSYFKAPIQIGADWCVLLVLVPLFLYTMLKYIKEDSDSTRLQMMSVYSVAFYFSASSALGLTYNRLHLVYIAAFTCSLFGTFQMARKVQMDTLHFEATRGIKIFLTLSGIALIAAWLPDIIPSLITGQSLAKIEVYTTEITYVLDMGLVGPLCIICLYLLRKKDNLGVLLLAGLLKNCIVIGIMIIPQTICQVLSGYNLTVPEVIFKGGSFVLLGSFAFYFNQKLYKKIKCI